MLRMFGILFLLAWPNVVIADPPPIKTSFETGYDVNPYRMGLVIARHRAAMFDLGAVVEPLMNPLYGRAVAVDDVLHGTLQRSLSNVLDNSETARLLDVQMMTNGAETLIAACGQVHAGAGNQPFLALFTNPHADPDIQSVGYSGAPWIDGACLQMGIN